MPGYIKLLRNGDSICLTTSAPALVASCSVVKAHNLQYRGGPTSQQKARVFEEREPHPPEVVQAVFLAQLVITAGNKAELIRGDAERGEDGVQELRVVGDPMGDGFVGGFPIIEEGVDLEWV
jgi:hypothetical protein